VTVDPTPISDEIDEEADARAIAKARAEIAGGQGVCTMRSLNG
jgi:hypothetical protein